MALDVLHRLRWRNLSRAAAGVIVAAAGVAWPRRGAPPPDLRPAAMAAAVAAPAAPEADELA